MARAARWGVGLALLASGGLLYAGSWQRWADACPWGGLGSGRCSAMEAHEYDFWSPTGSAWHPVGNAAELAGLSMLLLAVVAALLPWAVAGRLPGMFSTVATLVAVPAVALLGLQTLLSGRAGEAVELPAGPLAAYGWALVLPVLVGRLVVAASGWPERLGGVSLILALPVPGMIYWLGSYDSRPWYEAIAGIFTALAGLLLLVAAARRPQAVPVESGAVIAAPATS